MQFMRKHFFARQEAESHSTSLPRDDQTEGSHPNTSVVQNPANFAIYPSQNTAPRADQISGHINSNGLPEASVPLPENRNGGFSNIEKKEHATFDFEDNDHNEAAPDESPSSAIRSPAFIPSHGISDQHHSLNGNLPVDTSLSPAPTPRNLSSTSHLKQKFENLRETQRQLHLKPDGKPILPTPGHFPHSISVKIVPNGIDEPLEHVIILLHDYTGTEESLEILARRLNRTQSNSAYVLLRGIEPVDPGNCGYHWADPQSQRDEAFSKTSEIILTDVIKNCLVSKCNFNPRNIMLLGHCQGGMAALATAASWDEIELGGVISIGSPMPAYAQLPKMVKAKTPALIYYAELGDVVPSALHRIKDNFIYVDSETRTGAHDKIPESEDELRPILDFFAHRLEREEWEKQTIMSFDGGGVKGLGSLLILKALMDKIGDEERRSDRGDDYAESSFAPCDYKPMIPQTAIKTMARSATESTQSSKADVAVASATDNLSHSSLYLPCHYFTYAAGTSTGGLISIMLSRFRMTVDDCIEEYKTLGERIFGHPRPLAKGAFLWHKFCAKDFEEVIRDLTLRHSEASEFQVNYPSHEDLCRTLVFAYADHLKSEVPFFFRTYWTPKLSRSESKFHRDIVRNQGDPPKLPIWQVARATSAAPGYFPQIKIEAGNGHGRIRFKDGGFGTNNPSREAYHDIVNKHGGHNKNIGLFVSIGTGNSPYDMFDRGQGIWKNPRFWRKPLANLRAAIKLPSTTLNAHEHVEHLSYHNQKEFFSYFRFDGGDDLGKLKLDEWKSYKAAGLRDKSKTSGCITIRKIESAVANYLNNRDVQEQLKVCAKLLVRRRRLRTRDSSAWDRYASASHYECAWKGCEREIIYTAQGYRKHIKEKHHIDVTDQAIAKSIEKRMQESRHCWVYRNQPKAKKVPDANQVRAETNLSEAAMVSGAIQKPEEAQEGAS